MDYHVGYPPPPPPPPPYQQTSSFGYGVGLSIGVLFLITTITLVSYFCTRTFPSDEPVQRRTLGSDDVDIEFGIDEDTISSYPKLPFSEAKLGSKDSTSSCCSICLGDYKDDDMLRLLPDCGHLFHVKCVDPWLLRHPTCPVCRSSPIPTPLSTPLAEVMPIRLV